MSRNFFLSGAVQHIRRGSRAMHCLAVAVSVAALGGCTPEVARNPLADWVPSANEGPRQPVLIVLHATEQDSVQHSLDTLRAQDAPGPVSAHYLIGRDGSRYQLVADERRAWHAGAGRWGTITDVNSASIGIELDNDGEADFPPQQIASLLVLLEDLCVRLRIPRTQIIAHAEMAPSRKRDPGHRFPWDQLADAGFGTWPDPGAPSAAPGFDPWLAMQAIGYPLDDRRAAVRAFQRRFRALADPSGVLEAEDLDILHALTLPRASR